MPRFFFYLITLWLTAVAWAASSASPQPSGDRSRELLLASTGFADQRWDEAAGLAWSPLAGEENLHRVRESTWYALGLLERAGPGDTARALRIVEQVLGFQYTAPGQRWDGTFRRFLEEPMPAADAQLWKHYDPNWRHFIGTTFVLMLERHADKIPVALQTRLLDSIRRSVEGELTQGRDEPYHTNIKLMHGFLWSWAGARLGRADWVAGGERWLSEVATAFATHETFEEYNSPTYYGVDFYGLALARRYGATEKIRTVGAQLEAALWRDVARFYHAGLKNMAGPYDRAYGMDMRRYVSLTGVWMGLALPAELTPLPDPSGPMGHAHDFLATPLYVALGAQIPADVLPAFAEFQGERLLRRSINAHRLATAWIARDVMIGGEITGGTFRADPSANQFHPATIHWRMAENDVGWLKLHSAPALDAEAAKETLTLIAPEAGELVFRVRAPGATVEHFGPTQWQLPGLTLSLESNAGAAFSVQPDAEFFTVTFSRASRLVFRVEAPANLPETPKLAVVIAIDQGRADYLERFKPFFVEGGFRRLLDGGAVYVNAHHRHAMTATAPGHSTLLTGVHANVHGIIANEWFDFAAARSVGSVEDRSAPLVGASADASVVRMPGVGDVDLTASPRHLLAATVGDQLKLRYGDGTRVIGLANKDRGGIFLSGRLADAVYWFHHGRIVTSRYYRDALPAWLETFNAENPINRRFGETWDRLLDEKIYDAVQGPDVAAGEEIRHGLGGTFPRKIDGGRPAMSAEFHNAYRLDPHGSEVLGELIRRAVIGENLGQRDVPDLLCVGFSQLDYCGHSFGPDSHEIMDSVLRLDRVLADVFAFFDEKIGAGRWTAVLSADHGVAPLPERVAAFNRGVTSGRLDYPALTAQVEAALTQAFGGPIDGAAWTVRDSYGYRLIPATLGAKAVTSSAAQAVVKAALERSPQVAFAWTRDELAALTPPADGANDERFLAAWRLSWHAQRSQDVVFSPKPYVVDRMPAGSNHGTPYDYDSHIPLIFYGAGVTPGVHIERIGSDAIAPTLARLLGIPRPPQAQAAPLF